MSSEPCPHVEFSRGAESRCDRHHGETRVNHASRRIPWTDAVPAYMRRDAPICPVSDAATRGLAQMSFITLISSGGR